ncbi:hypothetical protein PR048_026757 [Dryococelus australis]|uniref:Uncharacterized protein n=1 Tax=Dryococelus australis TaxID=614101 RepID=A0ABQ9GM95_9NEOP|nr:hypothetical protein PR048_026757 [Dryococelus australis]
MGNTHACDQHRVQDPREWKSKKINASRGWNELWKGKKISYSCGCQKQDINQDNSEVGSPFLCENISSLLPKPISARIFPPLVWAPHSDTKGGRD